MRTFCSRIIFFCLFAALLCACSKKDDLLFRELTMAQLSGGSFRTDGGKDFQVVEQISDLDLTLDGRYLILCDVLRSSNRSDNAYEVRLLDFDYVLVKDIVTPSTITPEGAAADDPVLFVKGWIGGGYLNVGLGIHRRSGSNMQHVINLVYDADHSTADTLYFDLQHNALGDLPTPETLGKYDYQTGYCSFPIAPWLPSPDAKPVFALRGHWYADELLTPDDYQVYVR
ncbi:MAG: hypothetical protein IJV01_06905 [Bacteroidales bacterium]|nr:hypothetical protein [Bacteroidales bacterium]